MKDIYNIQPHPNYSKLRKKVQPGRICAKNTTPWTLAGAGSGMALKYGTNKASEEIRNISAKIEKVNGLMDKAISVKRKLENKVRTKLGYEPKEIPKTSTSVGIQSLDNLANKVDTIGTYGLGITTLFGLAIGSIVAVKKIRNSKITKTLVGEIDRLREGYTILEERIKSLENGQN